MLQKVRNVLIYLLGVAMYFFIAVPSAAGAEQSDIVLLSARSGKPSAHMRSHSRADKSGHSTHMDRRGRGDWDKSGRGARHSRDFDDARSRSHRDFDDSRSRFDRDFDDSRHRDRFDDGRDWSWNGDDFDHRSESHGFFRDDRRNRSGHENFRVPGEGIVNQRKKFREPEGDLRFSAPWVKDRDFDDRHDRRFDRDRDFHDRDRDRDFRDRDHDRDFDKDKGRRPVFSVPLRPGERVILSDDEF